MGSFNNEQAARAPIIETRQRVELRHPGNYLVAHHVTTDRLFRVEALDADAGPERIEQYREALTGQNLAVVPHCQQIYTNPDGTKMRMLAQCFWTLPIWGTAHNGGRCGSCANHKRDTLGVGVCIVIGTGTPDSFGCIEHYEPSREPSGDKRIQ
jgi:hypothetical protein